MQAIVYLRARAQLYQLGGLSPRTLPRGVVLLHVLSTPCTYTYTSSIPRLSCCHASRHSFQYVVISKYIQLVLEKYKVLDRNFICKPFANENSCHNQT